MADKSQALLSVKLLKLFQLQFLIRSILTKQENFKNWKNP